MTGRVTLQAVKFHETLLHTATQISHQGEQSARQAASWKPPEEGPMASLSLLSHCLRLPMGLSSGGFQEAACRALCSPWCEI